MKWPTVPLSSVTSLITKGTTPTTLGKAYAKSGIPFLRAENLQNGVIALNGNLLFIDEETDSLLSRSVIEPNDVLISIAGTIGRVGLVPDDAQRMNCNQAVAIVRPTALLQPRFLMYWLMGWDAVTQMAGSKVTQTISNLSLGQIGNLKLPLPAGEEQSRIVELLDEADRLRHQRREADAKAARILPALFLKMFGDPATNPMRWPKEPIGQLGNIVTGKTPPTNNEGMFDGTIPFATPGDLDNWLCSTQRTVTEAGANYTKLVRAGSALVGCIGNVGKMAKTPVPTTFNQQINAIEWSDRIDDDFGISALSFEVPTMQALATSTTLPILNKSTFSSIKLIVPPISDQAKFSRLAVLVQQSLTQSQSSSSRLEKLFEVLLARAFSGQLTAQWREGHMQELLAEMSQQARVLNLPMPVELEVLS